RGGAGTRNPRTGLVEYYPSDRDDSGRTGGPGRSPSSIGHPGSRGYSSLTSGRDYDSYGSRRGLNSAEISAMMSPHERMGMRGFNAVSRFASMAGVPFAGAFSVRPALNAETQRPEAQVRFSPLGLVGMPFGPSFALAQGPIEAPGTPPEGARRDMIAERRQLASALFRNVLGQGGGKTEEAAAPPAPSAARAYDPLGSDPLTYGQPGGAAGHTFFRSA